MRASEERRRIAATIGGRARRGAGAEELAPLRERLHQLGISELYSWSLLSLREPPPPAELRRVTREARRLSHSMDPPGGEAA